MGENDCPACRGALYVERRDDLGYDGHVTMVPCPDPDALHSAAHAARLAAISGLLPEEMALRLSDVAARGDCPGTAAMVAAARRFVDEPCGFLTVWGGYGNGKTMVLQAAVNEFRARRGVVGTYVRAFDLIEWVRAGCRRDAEMDHRARYERLKALPVLAVDELDAVRETPFLHEFRRAFLDDRYRLAVARRAHTLLAMNASPGELPPDVRDRLLDGRFAVVENRDPSMRPAMGKMP